MKTNVYIESQNKPCPKCGLLSGWWSGVGQNSMIFHDPNGEAVESRVYEKRRKHCRACDGDITECVS